MKNIKIIFTIIAVLNVFYSYGQTTIEECNCVKLRLIEQEDYIISGWAKEDLSTQVISYSNAKIEVNFYDVSDVLISSYEFLPSGKIIEGWQAILGQFNVPVGYNSLEFILRSVDNSSAVYFDDIRVLPFNSNLKSFVYNPESLKLMAELDENNYATFYEYDKEGGLIRVKKETENGIYTIQETRSKTAIKN